MRKILVPTTALIISALIGFLMLEIVFRFVILEHNVPRTEEEFTKWVSSSWPRPISLEKNPNTYRILGLADSFGCLGEPPNYHYVLESLLQNGGYNTEVVNFSVEAYDLPDELNLLKRFGSRYQPDIVLHGFFIGNDTFIPEGDLMIYQGISLRSSAPFLFWEWLRRYMAAKRNTDLLKKEITNGEPSGSISEQMFLEVEHRRLNNCNIWFDPAVMWVKTVKLLDEIKLEAKKMGAKYVIVIHPDQFQVDSNLLNRIKDEYNLDLDNYDLEIPQRFLKDYCALRAIPCLDLLPIFKANASQGRLYNFRETHYSEIGNSLAAEAIFDFLREESLLVSPHSEGPKKKVPRLLNRGAPQ